MVKPTMEEMSGFIKDWFPPELQRIGGRIVLDRETCDWIVDEKADSAICRTHGEVADGVDSKHFPGAHLTQRTAHD